jgi:hypothetical protein
VSGRLSFAAARSGIQSANVSPGVLRLRDDLKNTVPIRLLLIEDDALIIESIRDGLDPKSFSLHSARTLSEARRLI